MANTDHAHTAEVLVETAGAGGGQEPSLIDPNYQVVLWVWAIFFLLLFLLKKFAWGPILAALKEREEKIAESLDATRDAAEALEKANAEAKRLLEDAQNSASSMMQKATEDSAALAQELEANAKKEAEKIVEQARKTIASEEKQAIAAIRKYAADLTVAAAGKLINAQLDDEKNRALVDGYINELITEDKN